jgi:hypothetical protein
VATKTIAPTKTAKASPTPRHRPCADVTGDGRVTLKDLHAVAYAVARHSHNARYDVNRNGHVGFGDIISTASQLGRRCWR